MDLCVFLSLLSLAVCPLLVSARRPDGLTPAQSDFYAPLLVGNYFFKFDLLVSFPSSVEMVNAVYDCGTFLMVHSGASYLMTSSY